MVEKMKTISRKAAFILLAFLILAAVPAKSAEAKANLDISNVMNKTVEQAASYFNFKKAPDSEYIPYVYYNQNGSIDSEIGFQAEKENANKNGYWFFHINKDIGISVYGVKPQMKRTKAHKLLTKKGWKCKKTNGWLKTLATYTNAKGNIINLEYKNKKKDAKVKFIYVVPQS